MAGLVVVDTDLVIDFLRGAGRGVPLVRKLISDGLFRVTAITAFELRLGADFLPRGTEILRLLKSRTVPFDLPSALRAGEVFSTLRSAGAGVGMADCMLAGTCLRHDLPLATRNTRHFERVEGLQLVADA
ncbi:MAG: type II toxin-antitoxin system VapC family toxin [Actinomycetota bacterium]